MSSQSERIVATLGGVARSEYKGSYEQDLLAQYLMCIEMADRISERRSKANTFFVTANTAFVSAFGLIGLYSKAISPLVFLIAGMAAMVLCLFWYLSICSYRDLNTAKFKVIHATESLLPIRPYEAEWEAVGKGKDISLYFPFTHIERVVPWIFVLLYLVVLVNYFVMFFDDSNQRAKALTLGVKSVTQEVYERHLSQ